MLLIHHHLLRNFRAGALPIHMPGADPTTPSVGDQSVPRTGWGALPKPLLDEVLGYAGGQAAAICSGVCRSWRADLRDDILWMDLHKTVFGCVVSK